MIEDYKFGNFMKPQPNQFQTGDVNNPNDHTNWMVPQGNMFGGGAQNGQSQTQGQQPQTQQSQPSVSLNSLPSSVYSNQGTALGAVTQGWTPPSFDRNYNGSSFADPNRGGVLTDENGNVLRDMPGNSNQGPVNAGPSNGQTYMPEGVDLTKWNDPNKHDPKYDVLHLLSKYQPNSAGLQAAAGELSKLGISITGKDTIRLPNGDVIDVGRAFGEAGSNGQGAWYWSGPLGGEQANSSTGGMTNSTGSVANPNADYIARMMQLLFSEQQDSKRLLTDKGYNPSGPESLPPPVGTDGIVNPYYGSYKPGGVNDMYYAGGGIIDPVTGIRRNPRPGEPQ